MPMAKTVLRASDDPLTPSVAIHLLGMARVGGTENNTSLVSEQILAHLGDQSPLQLAGSDDWLLL